MAFITGQTGTGQSDLLIVAKVLGLQPVGHNGLIINYNEICALKTPNLEASLRIQWNDDVNHIHHCSIYY